VHRLDRDTSGVLLLAKKRSALLAAQAAIREGNARKRYLALLVGRMPRERVKVDAPLEKSVLQGGERMVRVDPDGKPSRSEFRLLEQRGDYAYVEVLIDTGRTHQIRVHAAHLGLPVAGDATYGGARVRLRAPRPMLHARRLAFVHPVTGAHVERESPIPADMADVLARCSS